MSSSIKDVARLAEVSPSTVSHVINGTRFVAEETRDKVLAAIQELEYKPNILARKFKTGARDTVGFVVPDIANGSFATLLEEVEDVLQTRGFRMIVSNTRESAAKELDSLRMLSSGVVDGVVIASTLDDYRQIEGVLPRGFPVVLVERALPNAPVDVLTTDNYSAVHAAVSELAGRGHRRIGFMGSIRHLSTTAERVRAYRVALRDRSIPVDENLIRYVESIKASVRTDAEQLLAQGCTAIVASNNVLTTKLLATLQELGVEPGEEVEILGYRDPSRAAYVRNPAELLDEPIVELGRLAGEAILRRVADPLAEPLTTVLHATYAARGVPAGGS